MRSKIKNFGEFEDFCQKHGLSRALNDILNIMSDSRKKHKIIIGTLQNWLRSELNKPNIETATPTYFLFYHLVKEVNQKYKEKL